MAAAYHIQCVRTMGILKGRNTVRRRIKVNSFQSIPLSPMGSPDPLFFRVTLHCVSILDSKENNMIQILFYYVIAFTVHNFLCVIFF